MIVIDVKSHTAVGSNAELVVALRGKISILRIGPDERSRMIGFGASASREAIVACGAIENTARYCRYGTAGSVVFTAAHRRISAASSVLITAAHRCSFAAACVTKAAADNTVRCSGFDVELSSRDSPPVGAS